MNAAPALATGTGVVGIGGLLLDRSGRQVNTSRSIITADRECSAMSLDEGRQLNTPRPISDEGWGVGSLSLEGGRQLSATRPVIGCCGDLRGNARALASDTTEARSGPSTLHPVAVFIVYNYKCRAIMIVHSNSFIATQVFVVKISLPFRVLPCVTVPFLPDPERKKMEKLHESVDSLETKILYAEATTVNHRL